MGLCQDNLVDSATLTICFCAIAHALLGYMTDIFAVLFPALLVPLGPMLTTEGFAAKGSYNPRNNASNFSRVWPHRDMIGLQLHLWPHPSPHPAFLILSSTPKAKYTADDLNCRVGCL